MDGLIILNKPVGLSSARALERVRRITGQRKSGHAGALDPAAAGVLVICLGGATRLVEALMDQPKVYRATARLDVTNEGFDSERPLEVVAVSEPPTVARIAAALGQLERTTEQVPPALSALKVRGRPAYRLARAGQAPALAPRPVRIYWLHLQRYCWPELDFELACGRGTYVRALVRDLGQMVGAGGCLTSLIRTALGPFAIEAAWTLERLAELPALPPGGERLPPYLIPTEAARALLAQRPVTIPARPGQPTI